MRPPLRSFPVSRGFPPPNDGCGLLWRPVFASVWAAWVAPGVGDSRNWQVGDLPHWPPPIGYRASGSFGPFPRDLPIKKGRFCAPSGFGFELRVTPKGLWLECCQLRLQVGDLGVQRIDLVPVISHQVGVVLIGGHQLGVDAGEVVLQR